MLEKVVQYVNDKFDGKVNHFERTVHWLKVLNPLADEAMQIAAYAHDIERDPLTPEKLEFYRQKGLSDPEYLKEHQEGGAKIILELLGDYQDKDRVANMIKHHEVGGDPESDTIKDADSISYFEVNAIKHIDKFGKPLGKDIVRAKYDWMYDRISSAKAREIALPMYQRALDELEKTVF